MWRIVPKFAKQDWYGEASDEEDKFEYRHEHKSYGEYAGSYAQDVMSYSDDDIDTIFDGDPSAYWNIDLN